MREITKLHLHHSQTNNDDFNGENHKRILRSFRYYHKKVRKWSDIGYHYLVFPDGEILKGRPLRKKPCSIKGFNVGSIAVCMVGNFDIHPPTSDCLESTSRLFYILMTEYNLIEEDIILHREKSTKTCPGKFVDKEHFVSLVELI